MRHEQSEGSWQFGDLLLSLKVASEKDREFCRHVHHEAYRDVVTRQFGPWDESLQNGFFLKVWNAVTFDLIHVNGEPAGCMSRIVQPDHIWIEEIQLLPAFQGRGIGSELLKREMEEAKLLTIPVRLQVLKANDRGCLFYQRLGFGVTGESHTHFLMEWKSGEEKE